MLIVKTFLGALKPTFPLQLVQELEALDIDVFTNDVLCNLVTKDSQLMRGTIIKRGSREKDPL